MAPAQKKKRCILARYAKHPVSPPFALKYARNALLFIWVVQRMRRTPPEAGADCWAREDPADTKPAGGDDGCEGLLGGRAAPRARLAVRMLPRPAPAPDAPWRPPGSGPLRVLLYSIIHSGGRHLAGDAQTRRRFLVRPCAQAGLCTFNFCRGTALTPLGKVLTDCADVAALLLLLL
ncbi:unnamed protein product [Parnassius apollo]|uniref:(apollo) hypothetical protein n=1 Tax=Parnassius apollo TaxID=110799 RepID=A0A8S3Y0B8_PARAO|nr:unnamed protein product [Parnassius apollo]